MKRTLILPVSLFATAVAGLSLGAILHQGIVGGGGAAQDMQRFLEDPEVRLEVVSLLAEQAEGIFDLHVDPDVGRVLQPGLDRTLDGDIGVLTNRYGMREAKYEIPKPDGLTRVVLLGDSFVYGAGVRAQERLGVHLAEFLRAGSDRAGAEIECLHLGVSSWNLIAECAYLRRQLELLQPDLVIQVSVSNDLNDNGGVRGVGVRARVTPNHRERADAQVMDRAPVHQLHIRTSNHLRVGLDWESLTRYAEAAEAVSRVADSIEARGGGYQLLLNWGRNLPFVHEHLAKRLREDQVIYLPVQAARDPRLVLGAGDVHWNPDGHRRIALLIYGMIVRRGLLPGLELEPWDSAEGVSGAMHDLGKLQALELDELLSKTVTNPRPRRVLKPGELTVDSARQVNGGLDAKGRIGAYASFLMPGDGIRELVLEGEYLGRAVLEGAEVRVFVDERDVGALSVHAAGSFSESWAIPPVIGARRFVTVRLESNDYVYINLSDYSCRVLALTRIEVR